MAPHGAPEEGFRLLSVGLLVYATSAMAGVLSATSFEIASFRIATGIDGGFFVLAAIFTVVASFVVLAAGFSKLVKGSQVLTPRLARRLLAGKTILFAGIGLLVLSGASWLIAVFTKGAYAEVALPAATVSAAAALTLPLSTAVPVVRTSSGPSRILVWAALLSGACAVIGEFILTFLILSPSGPPVFRDWLTGGGFPLINVNIPFGALAAASALMLWWVYRRLSLQGIPD